MKTLTLEQLKELNPCIKGFKWYSQNIKTENINEILHILAYHRWDWCRWLFVRLLSDKQNRQLAIYCAELMLPVFEEAYPSDKRPREAIEAAKLYLSGGIAAKELAVKRRAADAAYTAAYTAASNAAYVAYAAAAAYVAYAAAAAYVAYAAAAAYTAAYTADKREETIDAIIKKVIELIEGEE